MLDLKYTLESFFFDSEVVEEGFFSKRKEKQAAKKELEIVKANKIKMDIPKIKSDFDKCLKEIKSKYKRYNLPWHNTEKIRIIDNNQIGVDAVFSEDFYWDSRNENNRTEMMKKAFNELDKLISEAVKKYDNEVVKYVVDSPNRMGLYVWGE